MAQARASGFWVAPFGIDGELEGTGFWDFSSLTERWLEHYRAFLKAKGPNFDCQLDEPLSRFRLKLTSSSGAALLTISVLNNVASSLALLGGIFPEIDRQVARLFVDSVRRSALAKTTANSAKPFETLFNIAHRPLMAVIPWPNDLIPAEDYNLAREVGLHFSAAFFAELTGDSEVKTKVGR